MLKKAVSGWSTAPGAPKNWNPERDGDCGALPIRVYPYDAIRDGTAIKPIQWCESGWEPTPRDLEWLNAGGQIVLRVVGWQVPVALYVEPYRESDPQPALPAMPLEVSEETYKEIRRLLIADGKIWTFNVLEGREVMELSGVAIIQKQTETPA